MTNPVEGSSAEMKKWPAIRRGTRSQNLHEEHAMVTRCAKVPALLLWGEGTIPVSQFDASNTTFIDYEASVLVTMLRQLRRDWSKA